LICCSSLFKTSYWKRPLVRRQGDITIAPANSRPLPDSDIERHLAALNQGAETAWKFEDGKLMKTFRFPDFVEAFAFMTQAALVAERLNHHPDWTNVYGTVRVMLNTHDAGGVTDLDFELASSMEASVSRSV
jgi:4a-hydroxytetrahydrobiopterin dehydratase